jgi:dinuclear metal center YbgI/SA1388 family protein
MPGDRRASSVGDVAAALCDALPPEWAEPWDRVGLVVGEPSSGVTRALVTLDATAEAVQRAADEGAGLLVTHHPPFLEMPGAIRRAAGAAGTLEAAIRLGVAVISMHTNLDRSPRGADALSHALGLEILGPLERGTEPVSMIVTYVPADAVERVRTAMVEAGAGRLGEYERCAFAAVGTGWFAPRTGARPAIGASADGVPEERVEMLAPRGAATAVVAAASEAHPYEEPVVFAYDAERARGVARLGRICAWRSGATVSELASHVSAILAAPVRVWGDGARPVSRIAVANGSASSLIGEATARADVLVAGEVRYHDALDACAAGLTIVEAGHDVTEWPLVAVLADMLREVAPALTVHCEEPARAWWATEER